MDDTEQHFRANMLDGDTPQKGQMLSSEYVLEYIKENYDLKAAHPVPTPVDGELRAKFAKVVTVAARNAKELGSSPETLGDLLATDIMALHSTHLQAAVHETKEQLLGSPTFPHEWFQRHHKEERGPFKISHNGCHIHMEYVEDCVGCQERYPYYAEELKKEASK